LQALKREAATIGANGIIMSESTQQIASISKHGTSTERRQKACDSASMNKHNPTGRFHKTEVRCRQTTHEDLN
ncbi:MAG: hypothetical protein ABIN99_04810, partial [Nitrosospira sp.]